MILQSGPHNVDPTKGDWPYDQYVTMGAVAAWLMDSNSQRVGDVVNTTGIIQTSRGLVGEAASFTVPGGQSATGIHYDIRLPAGGVLNVSRLGVWADTVVGAPPPPNPTPDPGPVPPQTLAAVFNGVSTVDLVGQGGTLMPNGMPDWKITVTGLRATPKAVRITTGAGGIWETPYNNVNWLVAISGGEFYIEPFGSSDGLLVKVTYPDNTTDQALATLPPPVITPPPDSCVTTPYKPTVSAWPKTTGGTSGKWNPNGQQWVTAAFMDNPMRFESTDKRGCTARVNKP